MSFPSDFDASHDLSTISLGTLPILDDFSASTLPDPVNLPYASGTDLVEWKQALTLLSDPTFIGRLRDSLHSCVVSRAMLRQLTPNLSQIEFAHLVRVHPVAEQLFRWLDAVIKHSKHHDQFISCQASFDDSIVAYQKALSPLMNAQDALERLSKTITTRKSSIQSSEVKKLAHQRSMKTISNDTAMATLSSSFIQLEYDKFIAYMKTKMFKHYMQSVIKQSRLRSKDEVLAVFHRFDRDGDGSITVDEFFDGLKLWGIHVSKDA
eukprot:CAMPEP_0117418672 /NCGR_PEP_ID=MMETSP0758-20121206/393_1 /TAXON_ID=63605 /ORGANISM="Percolomonas cosmopolitus, Strain AE-1 (ATCC 50343)" /LENGTH=264 /DNA_ID=CAMNT_0005199289 /DNA_START=219 /DNA_END=1010 /DNA_ORIENTATION=-